MKAASIVRVIALAIVPAFIVITVIGVLLPVIVYSPRRSHGPIRIEMEMRQLAIALEDFRTKVGNGQYPPDSADDPEAVKQFLANAFPQYHGGLPEKYKSLDAASSLVFWLGGMTDKDGKPIGFSVDQKNPFDTANPSRITPPFDFDVKRLRYDSGLPVYLPLGNDAQSDPYVYFRADAKGEYRGAWKNCRPCRESSNGGWVSPKSYQIFNPGLDGKYGCGVQYPSGTDYDAQRKDDMSSFSNGLTLGDDMP
jgi:hypothetical protein